MIARAAPARAKAIVPGTVVIDAVAICALGRFADVIATRGPGRALCRSACAQLHGFASASHANYAEPASATFPTSAAILDRHHRDADQLKAPWCRLVNRDPAPLRDHPSAGSPPAPADPTCTSSSSSADRWSPHRWIARRL